MEFVGTAIPGCYQIFPRLASDSRGIFVKNFQASLFLRHGLETNFSEDYFSTSNPGVLRGLHFQTPPADHAKIVFCQKGNVIDVVVDLRVGSPTFGKHQKFELSDEKFNMLYLPRGLAHGFYVPKVASTLAYKVSSEYNPNCDSGILWSSVGIAWENMNPTISDRDNSFLGFQDFKSPFKYEEN